MALYPKTLYSDSAIPKRVWDEGAEKTAREQGWIHDRYVHQKYPKTKYHATKKHRIVNDADEETKLGPGWHDKPQEGNVSHIDPATIADTQREEMLERAIDPNHPSAIHQLSAAKKQEAIDAQLAAESASMEDEEVEA